jgi:hypothetical protein
MTRVRVILCLVLILFASGTRAQQSMDPLPCSYYSGQQETLAAAVGANSRSVLWVHRQGKDFPPCLDVLPSKSPYWIVNRDDRNRRFYVFTHDAISGVYSSSTRRNNFVTLDELSRGVENISAAGPSVGNELPITRFASDVYASENYSDLKLVLSGTLAGILLAIGLWRRDQKWGLIAARAAAGCPLALYAGGMPGFILWMLTLPWIFAAFLPVRITLGATALIVVMDQLTGLRYGDFSPLQGYFGPGIRFYGVGNELLGIITGTLAVCVSKRYRVYACIGCVLFFGNASLGADFGAVVTFAALIATDTIPRLSWFGKLTKPTVLLASIIIGIITAFAAAVLDMVFSPHMSHGGAALASASSKQSGIVQLFDIIWRKVLMNIEIALRPPTMVAFLAVVVLTWLGRRVFVVRLPWQSGIHYLSLAVVLSLVFNDSGVVTALMALLPALAMIPEVHKSNG